MANGKISGDPLAASVSGLVLAGVQLGANVGVPAGLFASAAQGALAASAVQAILPEAYGAIGDGATNDLAALNAAAAAAVAQGKPLVLSRIYAVSGTFEVPSKLTMFGWGSATGLKGLSVSGPVINTHDGAATGTRTNIRLRDFNISGNADAGLVVTHATVSEFSNITIIGLTAADGFVFEYMWANYISRLATNGATISNACFKVNKVVLDTIFDLCYTSNFADYNLLIDSSVQEYSVGTGTGFHQLLFRMFTAQGGDVHGIWVRSGAGVVFDTIYMENCLNAVRFGDFANSKIAIDCEMRSADLQSDRDAADYSLLLDYVTGFAARDCQFSSALDIRIGKVGSNALIDNPRLTGNIDVLTILKRTANAGTSTPLTIRYQGTQSSKTLMKSAAASYQYFVMEVGSNGAWVATEFILPEAA